MAGSADILSALGERPCTIAKERSSHETRCWFAWRRFPEPVKNRRSQYRMPLRAGLCSWLGEPIFYRLWASVPESSPRKEAHTKHGAGSHGGGSQSRLKTGAPSTECRFAPSFAHGWERRYFIGSGSPATPTSPAFPVRSIPHQGPPNTAHPYGFSHSVLFKSSAEVKLAVG